MSAHMKTHLTNNEKNILHIFYHGSTYLVPKQVIEPYKLVNHSHIKNKNHEIKVLAEELFDSLDKKYTKPGVLLKGLRHREGLSQLEFAKKIKVLQSDLSKMENGKRPIGKIIAKRIAKQFDIDYRSLIF